MLSAALILTMQIAAGPDVQETWVLEYPRIIQDEIDAYYGCLKSRGVVSPPQADPVFEDQHREHIPLCAKQLQKSLTSAKATLIGRKHYEEYDERKIAAAFETIGMIHIERGRKIDESLGRYLDQYATYDAAYEQTPEEVAGGERRAADLPPHTGQQ